MRMQVEMITTMEAVDNDENGKAKPQERFLQGGVYEISENLSRTFLRMGVAKKYDQKKQEVSSNMKSDAEVAKSQNLDEEVKDMGASPENKTVRKKKRSSRRKKTIKG